MPRRIRLTESYDDRWEARDLDVEVSAVGGTREEALDQLDGVVAVVTGDGGRKPTDEELRAAGVDPETNRVRAHLREELDEIRKESISADDASEDPSDLNEDADGDRSLDEIFDEDSDEESQTRALRQEHPTGWLHLTQHDAIPFIVDALLGFPPEREFTTTELAEEAGVTRESIGDYTDLLLEVALIEEVPNTSPRRYQVADSDVVREVFELNSALTNAGDE